MEYEPIQSLRFAPSVRRLLCAPPLRKSSLILLYTVAPLRIRPKDSSFSRSFDSLRHHQDLWTRSFLAYGSSTPLESSLIILLYKCAWLASNLAVGLVGSRFAPCLGFAFSFLLFRRGEGVK